MYACNTNVYTLDATTTETAVHRSCSAMRKKMPILCTCNYSLKCRRFLFQNEKSKSNESTYQPDLPTNLACRTLLLCIHQCYSKYQKFLRNFFPFQASYKLQFRLGSSIFRTCILSIIHFIYLKQLNHKLLSVHRLANHLKWIKNLSKY